VVNGPNFNAVKKPLHKIKARKAIASIESGIIYLMNESSPENVNE
jgi:hypothetical protein